jgi:flagellar motility protein MotE (MotC chaperone)
MIRLMQSHGFAAVAGMVLYLGVTAWFWPKMEGMVPPQVEEEGRDPRPSGTVPSWEFNNPELDQLALELRKEKAALAERSQQLEEFARRLQSERHELNVVTQAVHQMQMDLDQRLVRVTEDEATNVKKLARVYAAMTPEGAAGIIRHIDENTTVKILAFMKEDESGPILENLSLLGDIESRLAANLSERLRLIVARAPTQKSRM